VKVSRRKIAEKFTLDMNTPSGPISIPASVPGSIHTDLMAQGLLADIRISGSEEEQEWIRNADSHYASEIKIDNPKLNNQIEFLGLDTLATVKVDGKVVLQSENMHRKYIVDLNSRLDKTKLEVYFAAPWPESLQRQSEMGIYPNPYNMPYNYYRKMACSFGWDWGPITITSGIWKPIYLTSWDIGILDEVRLIASAPNLIPTLRVVTVGRGGAKSVKIEIFSSLDKVAEFETSLGSDDTYSLPDLMLWRPRGFGEPVMYEIKVSLIHDGEVIDKFEKRVGFRKISVDQSRFGEREKFAICVNDERVWCKGVNWIPDDPFPHRVSKSEYQRKLLDLFSVEVNAIRIWGGGIYESDDFYDMCDELGIIVWQDFPFACASYPETSKMFEEVKAEARDAITRLASHPSLVLWCGGNENVEGFQHWGWKEQLDGKAWGSTFYYETLPQILNELDGTRPYIPTSPFSTLVEDVKDFSSGTNHIWDVWNERGYQRYEDYAPSFSAEFGYNGPGSWLTLTKSIKKDNLDSTDADLANHQKAFDGMAKLAAGLKREFTNEFTQGPKWYFAAQLVQARAVEVGLKHFRSQYESCSGTMLWQYNDMWPAISWSVIDSSGARKLSWFAMREAYRPRFLHFSGEQRDLYIINDTSNNWKDKLTFYLLDQLGKLVTKKEIEVELSARSQQKYSLNELAPGIGTADLDGFVIAQLGNIRVTRRLRNSPVVKVNPPNYEISSKSVGSQLKIKLLAHDFLTEFSLLPELLAENLTMVSNQNITLLPGESCELEIEFHNEKDCEKIKNNLDQICFSLNHLMN